MLDQSAELIAIMAKKSPQQIEDMMGISPSLAELNFERFQDWEAPFTRDNARPALLAFNGDTYQGLDARNSFSERDFTHAQKTLRVLSGLYGVLRPLDLIQPYRLEMGSRLENAKGKDLYAFWREEVTNRLNADLAASPGAKVLVNCASNEYFGAVDVGRLDARVITPAFLDSKDGGPHKMVSFFAKRARGALAGWIIQSRLKSAKAIGGFGAMGYRFDQEQSTPDRPVFLRES